jgi:septal ring factor EnvC (AmiA/AmiB activator)
VPTFKDVAEGGTYGIVVGAMAWVANLLRRATKDTEDRAGRTIADLERDIAEMRTELHQCQTDHQSKDRRLARMERALILAGIELPP